MLSKKLLRITRRAVTARNPVYDMLVLEPKRKPWQVRVDFTKDFPAKRVLDVSWLRFKRKRDAVRFMKKVETLYTTERRRRGCTSGNSI